MPYLFKYNPLTGQFDMVTDPTEMIPHVALSDMPDLTGGNTDHDSRYALGGLDAALPAPGVAGRRYWATDTEILYRDTGAAWVEMLRGESVSRLAQLAERDHASLTNVLPNQHHAQQHAITAVTDHTSGATPGRMLQANANGLPVDATNTDAEVADAVTKKHTQNTDIRIQDADADTKIQVEEAADEDKIRFDTGGTERMVLDASGLDFKTLKAIAMVCDNGATVPAAPVAGQWFLHTPTGRNVLLQYSGTAWVPILSLGTMTLYIDKTDGTDLPGKGGAVDAGAFKTWQYAFDCIPPIYSGNITINVNDETYTETCTLQGKSPTGAYTITIQGTRKILDSGLVCAAGCLQGTLVFTTSHQYAKIIRDAGTWTTAPHQRDKKWVRMTSGAAYSGDPVIDSKLIDGANSTATALRPLGKFTNGAPITGDTFNVEEPGTNLTRLKIADGQKNVIVNDIDFDLPAGTISDLVGFNSVARFNRCQFDFASASSIWLPLGAKAIFHCCYGTKVRLFVRGASKCWMGSSFWYVNLAITGIQVDDGGICYISDGTILDTADLAGRGVWGLGLNSVNLNGDVLSATGSTFRVTIRKCGEAGIKETYNGIALAAYHYFILWGDDIMPNAAERATATTASKLVDTTVDFTVIGVAIGDKVVNLTKHTTALVTAIDSATQLSLNTDIMLINDYYRILAAASLNVLDTSASLGGLIQIAP